MIEIETIKERLAEWRQLKEKTSPLWISYYDNPHEPFLVDEEGKVLCGPHDGYGTLAPQLADVDFMRFAHNTPIEDDVVELIAEVERLRQMRKKENEKAT